MMPDVIQETLLYSRTHLWLFFQLLKTCNNLNRLNHFYVYGSAVCSPFTLLPSSPPSISRIFLSSQLNVGGFPDGSVVKKPPANAGNTGSITEMRRSPEGGNGNPLKHSCLENPREAWTEELVGVQSMGSQRVGHNRATKHTHTPLHKSCRLKSQSTIFTCKFSVA